MPCSAKPTRGGLQAEVEVGAPGVLQRGVQLALPGLELGFLGCAERRRVPQHHCAREVGEEAERLSELDDIPDLVDGLGPCGAGVTELVAQPLVDFHGDAVAIQLVDDRALDPDQRDVGIADEDPRRCSDSTVDRGQGVARDVFRRAHVGGIHDPDRERDRCNHHDRREPDAREPARAFEAVEFDRDPDRTRRWRTR